MPSNPKRLQDARIEEKKKSYSKEIVISAETPEALNELLLDIEKVCEDHEAEFSANTVGLDY